MQDMQDMQDSGSEMLMAYRHEYRLQPRFPGLRNCQSLCRIHPRRRLKPATNFRLKAVLIPGLEDGVW